MPVDKFGRMSDTKTKDTGVSLTYINNNYVRSDGGTPLTGSLDMRGNTIYNVADPVNPQDVVTKVYVDNTKGSGVIGRKIGDSVSIKENLDFLGKQKIKNLPDPVNNKDAVTKEYVDTTTVPFLKLDQTKYNTKGDIDMDKLYTVYNVKDPIDEEHITNKKYVDDKVNFNSAFAFRNGEYYAKGNIYLRKNKLGGLREPLQDGEPATKKYVDDTAKNLFLDENDNVAFGRDVDMEGNKIFSLPEPEQDDEPATKKYVDDLQTQYIDKKGNVKFDRNINVGNYRIFAVKDPKKDYEATNKKYVDESITKRLQEEKDNFLPQDPATKQYVDEAIKQVAGGDILFSKEGVFIKENGHYRATAPLDIDNQKVENIPDPVDEKDAVNKKYIDEIVENLTLKQGLLRENGGFNLVDSYINMNFNNIRNVGNPKNEADAVPRLFVDNIVKELEEKIYKRKQLIAVHANYCGPLKKGDYPFKFSGNTLEKCEKVFEDDYNFKELLSGFVMPHSGHIRKTICEGLAYINLKTMVNDIINSLNENEINNLKLYYKKEDFKNDFSYDLRYKVNFNIFSDKPIQNEKSFFEIVKIKKKFSRPTNPNTGSPLLDIFVRTKPDTIQSVEIKKFNWIQFESSRVETQDIHEVKLIMQISSVKSARLENGATLNIRIPYFFGDLFLEKNILNDILKPAVMHLFSKINFNITFLIELDPL